MHLAYPLPPPRNFASPLSLISLGTTVKYPGEIGNNGYAKFWEVNKVHCIMVYVKMVACTFLRMYVKVH